jgi:hypothetical protein
MFYLRLIYIIQTGLFSGYGKLRKAFEDVHQRFYFYFFDVKLLYFMCVLNYKPSFHLRVHWRCEGWADVLAAISVDNTSETFVLLRDIVKYSSTEYARHELF